MLCVRRVFAKIPISEAMLSASEINVVLECLHLALKEKIPELKDPAVLSVEGTRIPGTFGSLVLSVLLVGDIEAKLTLIFEWETATRLGTYILKTEKTDTFNEDLQLSLEEVFKIAGEKVAERFRASGKKVESVLLPSLMESNVLLSLHPNAQILKISIQTQWDPIGLYIAVPEVAEVQDAA